MSHDARFNGKKIKVVRGEVGARDSLEFYYGGLDVPDGIGCGHVISHDGIFIHFWIMPFDNLPVINDSRSKERLSWHGL